MGHIVVLNVWTYLSGSPGSELLGPRAGVPLLDNTSLLESLLDGSGSSGSGEGSDGVRGEDEVSVSDSLSGDGGGRAVNESLEISIGLNCIAWVKQLDCSTLPHDRRVDHSVL
jgi:hypothetical protein